MFLPLFQHFFARFCRFSNTFSLVSATFPTSGLSVPPLKRIKPGSPFAGSRPVSPSNYYLFFGRISNLYCTCAIKNVCAGLFFAYCESRCAGVGSLP